MYLEHVYIDVACKVELYTYEGEGNGTKTFVLFYVILHFF